MILEWYSSQKASFSLLPIRAPVTEVVVAKATTQLFYNGPVPGKQQNIVSITKIIVSARVGVYAGS